MPPPLRTSRCSKYRAGRYREAAQGYREATRREPNNPVGLRNLGDAYRKIGRDDDARAAYEQGLAVTDRMLAVNAHNAQTLQTRGILLAKLGRADEAVAAVDEAVRLAPNDADVLYERAVVLADRWQHGGGAHALERAIAAGFPPAEVARDDEWAGVARRCPLPPVGGAALTMSGPRCGTRRIFTVHQSLAGGAA